MHRRSSYRPAAPRPFHWKLSRGGILALFVALGAIACTEDIPTAPKSKSPTPQPSDLSRAVAVLSCTGNRASLEFSCETPVGRTRASAAGELTPRDIILGGQNVFVKLTSSNVAYNSGTGQFTFDVTIQNLIEQALGTTDGVTLAPEGVRIFFISGPNVTSGTGVASVLPDGFGMFTAPAQPYYQYSQVLPQNTTSAPRTWTLVMPPSVLTFSFVLLVYAPVQYENGYVSVTPPGNLIAPAATVQLTGTVKNANGTPASSPDPIVWSTSDPLVATVDGSGLVTGIGAGVATITATSGTRVGTATVSVSGATRTWTGSVSTDWFDGNNWSPSGVPGSVDTALVPTGAPRYPILTAAALVGGVTIQDAAVVNVDAFNLTLNASLLAAGTGNVTGTTGTVVLAGATHTVALPGAPVPAQPILVTGDYTTSGDVTTRATLQVDAGTLRIEGFTVQVDGT